MLKTQLATPGAMTGVAASSLSARSAHGALAAPTSSRSCQTHPVRFTDLVCEGQRRDGGNTASISGRDVLMGRLYSSRRHRKSYLRGYLCTQQNQHPLEGRCGVPACCNSRVVITSMDPTPDTDITQPTPSIRSVYQVYDVEDVIGGSQPQCTAPHAEWLAARQGNQSSINTGISIAASSSGSSGSNDYSRSRNGSMHADDGNTPAATRVVLNSKHQERSVPAHVQQPQQQQLRAGGARRAPRLDPPQLTARVLRCGSVAALKSLMEEQLEALNARHVAIMLHRLPALLAMSQGSSTSVGSSMGSVARASVDALLAGNGSSTAFASASFARSERVAASELASRLEVLSLRFMGTNFGPQDLSNCIWALAKLRHAPSPRWLASFFSASTRLLPAYEPRHLASTLWALGSLQAVPPTRWLHAARAELLSAASGGALTSQGFAISLWAIARIATAAPAAVVAGGPAAGPGTVSLPPSTSSAESSSPASLAPPTAWVNELLAAGMPLLPASEPRHISMAMWALAALGHRPPRGWLEVALQVLGDRMAAGGVGPQALSNSLWALARLVLRPPLAFVQSWLGAAEAALPSMSPQQLANAAWALARLGVHPGEGFMLRLLAAAQGKLMQADPQDLSSLAWALAKLGARPSSMWMDALAQASQEHLADCTPQGLSVLAWSLSELRYRPPQSWMRSFMAASAQLLPVSGPQALSNTTLAVARMGARPTQEWLHACTQASAVYLQRQQPAAVQSRSKWGLNSKSAAQAVSQQAKQQAGGTQTLSAVPEVSEQTDAADEWAAPISSGSEAAQPSLLRHVQASARAHSSGSQEVFSAQELAALLWGLGRLGATPPPSWLALAEGATLAGLQPGGGTPPMPARCLSTSLYGMARLRHMGHDELLGAACEALRAACEAQQVSSQDLANALWALAAMRYAPPAPCLEALAGAAQRLMGVSSHAELAQMAWAFSKLGYQPSSTWLSHLAEVSYPLLVTPADAKSTVTPASAAPEAVPNPAGPMSYISVATLLATFAQLGYRPPTPWLERAAAAAARAHHAAAGGTEGTMRKLPRRQREALRGVVHASLRALGFTPPPWSGTASIKLTVGGQGALGSQAGQNGGQLAVPQQYIDYFYGGGALLLGAGSALLWG